MAAIKIHGFVGENDGTKSCDFRGDKFIGHEQGDEHRTIFEIDPASDEQLELVLEHGPEINELLSKMSAASAVHSLLGKSAGLRIGVWDN